MRAALALARRGLGRTWPNPSVGTVLVRDGRVVGRGWTQPGGRPHAEAEALRAAGGAARGATAYVTLEPCSHHGRTPPCAEALVSAGIARAVVAVQDPDPRVSGGGNAALEAAGIAVATGLCEAEAREINAGFFCRIRHGRPLVTAKAATGVDGRIATHAGESRWITGPAARARAHLLRATHDAVMLGIGTAAMDDPQLTVRLSGLAERQPVRIVVDGRLRLPLTNQLVRTAKDVPTWIITVEGADSDRQAALAECGVEVIAVPRDAQGEYPALDAALCALGERGLTRVLVEGGGHLLAALLRAQLVDRMVWFRAGLVIGGDGVPVAVAFGVDKLADAPRFVRQSVEPCGDDVVETWARTA
ncbi:MAG TPA: bifunctional diaminohydroxyphosphoribosylaminopyrimidine deaminase/5-amino-6-(5-phosphoribosylamino)uracil reductase RibD [Alphaproteobacteria bacterium]|nr:bifunctional diaminohydroxyphosphoribosylaminopyrimidine deaminase/5-amino-6-(5-phosphoribosylamino)uracil reductase RibD [Alphaproteobacteria bacterium]